MLIQAYDCIIIRKDEYFKSTKLDPDSAECIDGTKVSLKNAVGLPYGTMFTIVGDQVEPIFQSRSYPEGNLSADESLSTVAGHFKPLDTKDNRDIVDSTSNQKLDYEDIKSLQAGGTSGEEILSELIKGNTNFEKKTKFSQDKYVSKKRKRHLGLFSIERPCTRILCELYSKIRPEKCL
ncbi:hypothetical protein EG68_12099 [Paragonimus skrjabini miyazakii]|uniref:tRNA (adenine(58)-N(1))-methyltransferase non-catalytic subunit TRM6 n=1 Tax=Paragonimus skrjabini miyazakii TaxID=59628 RepID=A0A8S9YCD8_9TREM|nr:hypothetical protein EG68_12099 [Paragonimus skrjabini miyazakii]